MKLSRLAFVYLAIVVAALVGLPFLSSSLGLESMTSFKVWLGLLSVCWWVTWLGVILVFFNKWRAAGVSWIAVGLILGAASMGILAYLSSLPPLHYISNNIQQSPRFVGGVGGASQEQVQMHQNVYPNLKPLALTGSFEKIWQKLSWILKNEQEWQVDYENKDERKIQVTCKDRLFGFTDIMVLEVFSLSENVQSVHILMKSEMDLGAGVRRLNRLADHLKGF